ncbi:carboxypeptidase-like regulatory domain-containing protein [Ekhidna sp.]|uniref:carboxypeptidase-like regulatory domain-containing protein n=1 Tax=Ekhidna sp. TaxID=2608089 RepID=UPI003C7E4046
MRCLFVVLFLMLGVSAFSQQLVKGKITDADTGVGLIGAHVYLLNNWRKGAISDANGRFTMSLNEVEMQDSLIISYVGFMERIVAIAHDLIVELEPLKVEGETVVVTAKPLISEEFKYMEIRKIDIYTNPSAKADPLLAVNSLPSSTTTDESANISLRGSSPVETGIFLNNVPIYDGVRYSQLNGIGTFSIFNTSIIQGVTVFPGNPPLEFGNATSGIIAMETDEQILGGNTNSLILSLANVGFSREQKINDKQSLKLFTNWQPSAPIKRLNTEALEDIESFTSNDLGIYWYGNSEKVSWKVLSYSVTEGYEFNFDHPSYNGIFDQEKNRSFLISTLEKPMGKGVISLNNGLSYSDGDYSYSNVAFKVRKKDLFFGGNYLLSKSRYSIKSGLSYDFRNSRVNGNFHEYEYALGSNHPTVPLNEDVNLRVLEAFGYFKYFFSERVAMGTGLRKNLPLDDQESYLSSQLNLSYSKNEWTITLGGGVYNKHGLFENTGEPFTARNYQKSIDIMREKTDLEVALSFFEKEGEINGMEYYARGAELFTDYRFSSKLSMSGSVTLLNAENEARNSYAYDLSYFIRGNIAYSPGRFWTIESILVSRQGTTFIEMASANFDSSLNVYEPQFSNVESRLPAYSNIGLSISKVFAISEGLNIIAFASLNNALNNENIRSYTYNFDYTERERNLFSRRTAYFGVVINF